jgi:hypothetical protein
MLETARPRVRPPEHRARNMPRPVAWSTTRHPRSAVRALKPRFDLPAEKSALIKINFGSGPHPLGGWINVDIDTASRPDVVADLSRPLPFADRCADFMHTEDFIAQLEPEDLLRFLHECRRVLKSDGGVRVLTPDLARFARMYLERPDDLVRIWNTFVGVKLVTGSACEVVNLGMKLAGRFQYDYPTFSALADAAGFVTARVSYNESRFQPLRGLDLRRPDDAVSMYLECTPKPR